MCDLYIKKKIDSMKKKNFSPKGGKKVRFFPLYYKSYTTK